MCSISEKIYNLRKNRGLSQEELGFEIKVSRQTVSKWEMGTAVPDFKNLVALSEFFNVDINYFVSSEGEISADSNETVVKTDAASNNKPKSFVALKILLGISIFLTIILIGVLILINYILTPDFDNLENIVVTSDVISLQDIQLLCGIAISVLLCLNVVFIILLLLKRKNRK